MEILLAGVNWLAVGVSTIICYMLAGLWYSPKLFGNSPEAFVFLNGVNNLSWLGVTVVTGETTGPGIGESNLSDEQCHRKENQKNYS